MNKDIAIRVSNLSKSYSIGKQKDTSLRSSLSGMLKSSSSKVEKFWALKDVSFEINKGDVIGIIGKNGAGKSTLLKILSQITKPSEGRIELNGRVASLLEVGTGFHPELTGRENIYLNGTILGMTRKEVKAKFDEIVEFSGVQKFIDTPVKHYSSGMYVRLAFAVAAHLEPEILIIDEVLAVGDAEFQKKCMGKMKDVAEKGRTVLFVSHNMAAVKSLCTKGIVMDHGQCVFHGEINDVVNYYFNSETNDSIFHHNGSLDEAPGNENIKLLKVETVPREGDFLSMFSGINFNIDFYNRIVGSNIDLTIEVGTKDNLVVFHNGFIINEKHDSQYGIYSVCISLPQQLLNAGIYTLSIIFGENQRYQLYKTENIITFEVMQETTGSNSSKLPGLIFPKLETTTSFKLINNEAN